MKKKMGIIWSQQAALDFFADSDFLDYAVLRPIDHVFRNWELTWDSGTQEYKPENDSFASHLNVLIQEIASSHPPDNYHNHEDKLTKLYSGVKEGRYKINLSTKLWIDASTDRSVSKDTLSHMIEQATCAHDGVPDLVLAAAGRVARSMNFNISHFDDLDRGHMEMLAVVMMIILFRRSDSLAK